MEVSKAAPVEQMLFACALQVKHAKRLEITCELHVCVLITCELHARGEGHVTLLSGTEISEQFFRDLSLNGRVLLSKAEGLSHLTHAAFSLSMCPQLSSEKC